MKASNTEAGLSAICESKKTVIFARNHLFTTDNRSVIFKKDLFFANREKTYFSILNYSRPISYEKKQRNVNFCEWEWLIGATSPTEREMKRDFGIGVILCRQGCLES